MKNKIINVMAITLLLGLFASATQAASKVPVKVELLQEQKLNSFVDVHGAIYGRNDVTLTSSVAGRLEYVAEPGQFVEQGEVIAQIDTVPLKLQLAEQTVGLKRKKLVADFQKIELSRYQSLSETDATAQYQIDLTQNNLDLALADIEMSEVKIQQLQDQIARASIIAPFSGVVAKRYQRAGTEISRAVSVVDLLDTTSLEARLYLPIKYLNVVRLGQFIQLKGVSYGGDKVAQAQVHAIVPHTDERSQTFEVRAKVEKSAGNVWATGELVDVRVGIENIETVKLINRDALIIRKNGIHIVKIDADNTAVRIPVEIGNGQDQLVEVKATDEDQPLTKGDRIAVRGAERLENGQEVDVQS